MEIEVIIVGWEQDCCGSPFQVGEPATWNILAAEPNAPHAADPQPGTAARFVEEHHDQTPADVPHWKVTGTVVAITGIRYPRIPAPGLTGTYTADLSAPESHPLDAVGDPDELDFSEYRVRLDVPPGTELPAHTLSAEALARQADEARATERNRLRLGDPVGLLLEALADDAEHRYAHLARTSRATGRSAMTLEPRRAEAAAIRWLRSEDEHDDGITVQIGDGSWRLPATDVALVREFLDAAVHGRVLEHVRPAENPSRLDTEVLAADGRSWTATRTFAPFGAGGIVAKRLWDRVQRGEHRYSRWDAGEPASGITGRSHP